MAGRMQKKRGFGVVLVGCLVALFQVSWAAKSHTVGDTTGWTNSPPSSTFYPTWAASQTFAVGDSLVFNFGTGGHTVAEVSKSDYDSCTTTSPISTATTGPATLKITTAGSHYYICTIPGHCRTGQKLAVTTTTTPSPSPSRSSRRSSPPPSGSAASPASSVAPAPSSPGASSPSPSGGAAASPSSSTTPAAPAGSSTSTTAPPPSSANLAGAGMMFPFMLVAANLLF